LRILSEVLQRNRWFFVKITGRRRIGKTTLIQQALQSVQGRKVFYVQIPDSGPAGVLSAVADAMETFQVDVAPRPTSLRELASTILRAMGVDAGTFGDPFFFNGPLEAALLR
jgi:KaiC/GvpD/RAD55 family RecA-like ATPase